MNQTPSQDTIDPPRSIASKVGLLVDGIANADNGMQADLRRMDPTGTKPLAYYRLTADLKVAEGDEALMATLVAAIATIPGRGATTFGTALARADLSEMRLARLLQADAGQLPGQVRGVVRLLDSRGQSHLDWRQLAYLLLSRDQHGHDQAARRIARDYYRNQSSED